MSFVTYKRHHDDEIADSVSIECVPRFKTSGLSGDEWRVSYRVQIRRKGTVLFDRCYTSLDAAVTHLPWILKTMFEGGCDGFNEGAWSRRIEADNSTCHQVGCAEPATVVYRLKQRFAENGDGPLPPSSVEYRAAFCARHSERGDCGREDADDNYDLISGVPHEARAEDERPSLVYMPDGELLENVARAERPAGPKTEA